MSILVAPLEALTDSLLSDPERRVLLALFSYRGKVTELVFPSLDALSERSNINDKTRISKITTSLAKKGWLTKKKKGFTGCNQYTMCMPERLANLDLDAKLVLDTKLDADTKPNLDLDAKYDVGLSCHVQRTNQVTNHINKPVKSSTSRFIKPLLSDISQYMANFSKSQNITFDNFLPDNFFDYYESNGWKRGNHEIEDWQATARGWVRKQNNKLNGGQNAGQNNQPANNSAPARVRAINAAKQAQRDRTERTIN